MKNTLKYSLHMQKNPMHPEEPEKAYARLQLNGVLDINALAAHMANHNSIYSKGTIVGIITDMCHCIKEAITEGNAIELGELGRFTPSITSEGTLPGVDEEGNPKTAMEMFTEARTASSSSPPRARLRRLPRRPRRRARAAPTGATSKSPRAP